MKMDSVQCVANSLLLFSKKNVKIKSGSEASLHFAPFKKKPNKLPKPGLIVEGATVSVTNLVLKNNQKKIELRVAFKF